MRAQMDQLEEKNRNNKANLTETKKKQTEKK